MKRMRETSRSEKKVILISEDEELNKSFKRAFSVVGNIEVTKRGFSRNKNMVLLYVDSDRDDVEKWLCGNIRTRYLNPVVVLGYETKEDFEERYPVFKDRPYSHSYISIPFDLKYMIEKMRNVKPIYDATTRKMVLEDYCKGYEYKLITHDLKVLSGDKVKTLKNFCMVRDFYKGKGDGSKVEYITGIIKKIEKEKNWEETAMNAKKFLENKLKKAN